jgi:hypothetical protein
LRPFSSTEWTEKAIASSVTEATSSTTVDPAGIDAPFDPEIVFATVATNRSPGRLDDVQMRC